MFSQLQTPIYERRIFDPQSLFMPTVLLVSSYEKDQNIEAVSSNSNCSESALQWAALPKTFHGLPSYRSNTKCSDVQVFQ